MRRLTIGLVVLSMLFPAAYAVAGNPSYITNKPVELTGTFGIGTGYDANDKVERYYYIKLDHPINVKDTDFGADESNVTKIQLAPGFYQSLHNFKGKRVVVKGELFHSFTAHHHTKILLAVDKRKDFRLANSH